MPLTGNFGPARQRGRANNEVLESPKRTMRCHDLGHIASCIRGRHDAGEISQAAQRSGDKSRQALVAMYGNVVNNPLATGSAGGGDTILASLFQVTNGALLVIGAIFTCYMMFLKVSQTAHDGAVFDRAKTRCGGRFGSFGALRPSCRPRMAGHSRSY